MNMKLRSVLITGASSGIGRALALQLAQSNITLHLAGRRVSALVEVADMCSRRGSIVHTKLIDVCDRQKMDAWIKSVGSLDLVLVCAGISTIPHEDNQTNSIPESLQQVEQIMQTNIFGVLNTVLPALEVMKDQKCNVENLRGRIAVMSSIAGFFASAWAPSYCASKAAIDRFIAASGAGWKQYGIQLTSICCGFVTTPMTQRNKFYMPGKISADQAAQLILTGIEAQKRRVIFPYWLIIIARVIDLIPISFLEKIYLPYLQEQDRRQ